MLVLFWMCVDGFEIFFAPVVTLLGPFYTNLRKYGHTNFHFLS